MLSVALLRDADYFGANGSALRRDVVLANVPRNERGRINLSNGTGRKGGDDGKLLEEHIICVKLCGLRSEERVVEIGGYWRLIMIV